MYLLPLNLNLLISKGYFASFRTRIVNISIVRYTPVPPHNYHSIFASERCGPFLDPGFRVILVSSYLFFRHDGSCFSKSHRCTDDLGLHFARQGDPFCLKQLAVTLWMDGYAKAKRFWYRCIDEEESEKMVISVKSHNLS